MTQWDKWCRGWIDGYTAIELVFFCYSNVIFVRFLVQLVMTVGLLAVVVYLYTVVAFNFFRKFYNMSEDEDEPDMKCDDMMTVSDFYKVRFRIKMLCRRHPFTLRLRLLLSATCSTCMWV